MTDHWHELPATDRYSGRTQLTRDGRTFVIMSTGPAARKALVERAGEKISQKALDGHSVTL